MVQEATTSVNALNRLVQSQFAELGWRQFAGATNSARVGDSRLPAHLEKSLHAFRNDETLGFYRALSTAVRGKTPFLAASKFLTREFPLANRCLFARSFFAAFPPGGLLLSLRWRKASAGVNAAPRFCYNTGYRFAVSARSPSGKAKVCKTFIGGSIPPRASNFSSLNSAALLLAKSLT